MKLEHALFESSKSDLSDLFLKEKQNVLKLELALIGDFDGLSYCNFYQARRFFDETFLRRLILLAPLHTCGEVQILSAP